MKIREQDPLKQGLKQGNVEIIKVYQKNSRARSIKTRIETQNVGFDTLGIVVAFASKIH